MSFINFAGREIQCKIVYYGPGRCGKTTNLKYIYSKIRGNVRGKMISIDTKGDKTLFFDFLPLDLGKVGGFSIRIQLYTVPGQVHYNATRKLVLKGVDGVVFVADSLRVRRDKNVESMQNLVDNLQDEGIRIEDIPLVIQYNKRDLQGGSVPILPLELLEQDLNSQLKVPSFPASAVEGYGVFETLRAISKAVAKDVSRRVLSGRRADLQLGERR
ncbi:MAG: GTP-binding protein [Thermodesulfobacteriota bacterium]